MKWCWWCDRPKEEGPAESEGARLAVGIGGEEEEEYPEGMENIILGGSGIATTVEWSSDATGNIFVIALPLAARFVAPEEETKKFAGADCCF